MLSEPAVVMTILWLGFGGTHVILASRRVRAALVARFGESGFTALFSAVAVVSYTALVMYYAAHRDEGTLGLALGHVPAVRWLLIAAIGAGFALMTAGLITHQDRKLLARRGQPYAEYVARTSTVPFAAALAGESLAWDELPLGALAAGLVTAVVLRFAHDGLFAHGGLWIVAAVVGGAALASFQASRRARRVALRPAVQESR